VPDFLEWRKQARSFTDLAGFREGRFHAEGGNSIPGAYVTGNFFATLQVNSALGRLIEAQDDQPGHDNVAVISDALWHSRFGGELNVLGQTLTVNKQPLQVIGVMAPEFSYPHASDFPHAVVNVPRADVWIPFGWTDQQKSVRGQQMDDLNAITRLRPGMTIQQAQAELAAIEARVEPLYPDVFRGWRVYLQSFTDSAAGEVRLLM